MLVDNAVVIVENIAIRLQRGDPTRSAVVEGAAEVACPLFFAQTDHRRMGAPRRAGRYTRG